MEATLLPGPGPPPLPPPGRRDRVSQSPNDGLAAETDDDALGVASWPRPPL